MSYPFPASSGFLLFHRLIKIFFAYLRYSMSTPISSGSLWLYKSTEREAGRPPRPGRKKRDLKGKKLFENPETSSEEESPPSESEDAAEEDDDDDDNTPLFHVRHTMRRTASSNRNAQKRPPRTPPSKVREPDLTQATSAEITLEEQEVSEEVFGRGPLSPDDPLMIGSATEEQLPVMQFGEVDSNATRGELSKVRM